ncbi:MAG: hypothetical protein LBJ73_03045 [Rickettsiales bacterium]|jgi:hypothetical protein|nr:hypothetical protein [Rickettsiales bacterium]
MHNLFKSMGLLPAVFWAFFVISGAHAATGRDGYNVNYVSDTSRAGMLSGQQRMPTMPTLPGNSVGNISVSVPTSTSTSGGGNSGCTPGAACPCPTGATGVCNAGGTCDCPVNPGTGCADGGVKDSDYTVENCVNDVLACVNNGALPGGLNDLFNEDLRNAIFNGMSLCYIQVEKCVTDVRRDCRNIYNSSSDVWWDFNSRKVQPEYYSFILRRTGLTPNQAENTCLLLDRNTYGSSFNAVAGDNGVTAEYDNRVGAYNSQVGNTLVKTNPQGVAINTNGKVDANRGHYARWDATTGECLVRVAAYNKDSHIKNSWLFGALGDDKPAEVWKPAGGTFSCNKDLFGFSLLNNTSTVAVVGIGGGTLAGAGVGAIAGHGKREFDCGREGHLEELTKQIRTAGHVGTLNEFIGEEVVSNSGKEMTRQQCEKIKKLYDDYIQAKSVVETYKHCLSGGSAGGASETTYDTYGVHAENFLDQAGNIDFTKVNVGGQYVEIQSIDDIAGLKEFITEVVTDVKNNEEVPPETRYKAITVTSKTPKSSATSTSNKTDANGCPKFPSLNQARITGSGIWECSPLDNKCVSVSDLKRDVDRINSVMDSLPIIREGEDSNMLSSTLIGAGIGAGAGGLATMITSFVEKNNINCRVGDGLEKVSYGKSHSLGTLKDYYVKWNLRLPDTIMPTAQVVDCTSWKSACGTLKDLNQCVNAQINYRPVGANFTTLVSGACAISGSVCIENHSVASSQNACE